MKCRVCGCTDERACIDEDGNSCCWVRPGLCSACVCPECGSEDVEREEDRSQMLIGLATIKCRDCEHDWERYV